jgi:hypothetical protein
MRKAIVLFCFALLGCGGPDIQTLCEDAEACTGGNEADVEACVTQSELYLDLYDEIGCGDEYDALLECAIAESSCRDQSFGQSCQTTEDCNGIEGARCVNNECSIKVFGPREQDSCEVEQTTANRCGDLD